jgi:superoxide reductase
MIETDGLKKRDKMANKLEVYKCMKCGIVAEVLHAGSGQMVCCGEPMKHLAENTTDAAKEKHVPVVEKVDGGYKVAVGSVPHPMQPEHSIEWIELLADGVAYRRFLEPGQAAEAVFHIQAESVSAREFCNLHGLWKGQ